jgi:hypothetical protein
VVNRMNRMSKRVASKEASSAFFIWRAALQCVEFQGLPPVDWNFAHAFTYFWDSDLFYCTVVSQQASVSLNRLSADFHRSLGGEAKRSEIWSQPIVRLRVLFSPL